MKTKITKLKPYQKQCDKCPKTWYPRSPGFGNKKYYICEYCKDTGIVDWIDELKNR